MTTSTPPAPALHPAAAFVLTAFAYALGGIAALALIIPPGLASPLDPSAGIALASVLIFGRRMLPAVALGAFCLELGLATQQQHLPLGARMLALPAVIAIGAALQALVGATLVERFAGRPLTLSDTRSLVAFVIAAMLSSVIGAGVSNLDLWLAGEVGGAELPFSLATWWIGDVLGMLIATPVVLTWIGDPRPDWSRRRLSVGLTLVLATLLLVLAIRQVVEWDTERVDSAFDRSAEAASQTLAAQLLEPLHALEAVRGVFVASDYVKPHEMALATQVWLAGGSLQAIGWSDLMRRDQVPGFEARVRAEGSDRYTVFDRSDAPGPTATGDEVLAIHFIEPRRGNEAALGLNVLSVPAARAAIEVARRTGQPAATAGFQLTQASASEPHSGVVIYQALYEAGQPRAAQRPASMRGAAFVTLRMDDQLHAVGAVIPPHLELCLVDATAGQAVQRLAGSDGCETGSPELQHVRSLPYAGRQWEVRVGATRADMPDVHSADVWPFALVGLFSIAMLGGFLLIITGRAHRIEIAVHERTVALRAEAREREVAEAAMRESEERFRNILNSVPIGVIYSDLRGAVKQTNPRFLELTGYSEAEMLTLGLADYTHPEDLPQDIALLAQLVRGEIQTFRRQERYITKHGAEVRVQVTVSVLRDAGDKPRSIVGVVEDITEHLQLEEAERAREAAEASNQAKSEFLSRMSHELRTPLNAMLGFAQLLEMDVRHPLATSQRPWVDQIQQAGWHLLEMINDVLDMSRIESGNLRLQIETLDLREVLAATVSMVEGDARRRGLVISQDLVAGTPTVLGDATRVKQILTNLLSNAVKYNIDAGRIHIACRSAAAGVVEVTVTDTGLGMTADQLAELFQPFNRLGRERSTQHQGTGIGLVISQRLAELMGGTLKARSVAGQGSSFILSLPCSDDPDTVRSELDSLRSVPAEYHRRMIHYVEDNETNIEVMRGILAQRPQVEMQVSMNGLDGVDAIRAQQPDLVLLDMNLPDISGIEVLHRLKADPRTADVPVVVVSADALADQIDAAFDAGCAHYLTKPVSVSELLSIVDHLLEQSDTRFGL